MQTPLTTLLRIRVPLICSPMAGAAGGLLASSVTFGGGLGFIAGGHQPLAHLKSEINLARKQLKEKEGEDLGVGIGLIAWRIEEPFCTLQDRRAFIDEIIGARPRAVWFSFGRDLKALVDEYQVAEGMRGGTRAKVCVMVGTVAHAVEVAQWGTVDIVVGQGIEAGGHGLAAALPLLSLLPQIQLAFQQFSSPPLLVAAGGLTTGAHLLSVLPFADGIVMGTAFLATPESLYSPAQKDLILKSSGEETLRGLTFDFCRSTLGFPSGVNGRAVRNLTSDEGGDGKPGAAEWTEELREKFKVGVEKGDTDRIVTWAGTSVGLVTKLTPADDLVRDIEQQSLVAMERLERFKR